MDVKAYAVLLAELNESSLGFACGNQRGGSSFGPAADDVRLVPGTRPDEGGLCALLEASARLEGLDRLRFLTSNPFDMTEDMMRRFGAVPKVMPWLHIPAQAGAMARPEPIMQPTIRRIPRASASRTRARASVRPPVLSSLMFTAP